MQSTVATSIALGQRLGMGRVLSVVALLTCVAPGPTRADETSTVAARLEAVTRGWLGRPYVVSPLGEGAGIDPDPRWRDDAFDCTTFVETALARLSDAPLGEALDRLRYAGEPSYEHRRHLVEAQWLPDLVRLGVLEPFVPPGLEAAVVVDTLALDPARWKARRIARSLKLEAVPFGEYAVSYLPLDTLIEHASDLPPGLLVNVIRQPVPWSPTWVTHQGLLLRNASGALVLRHASPVAHRVIDEPLPRLLSRYKNSKANRAWPIVGLQLFRVRG